jgi:hypothetical protein
VAVTCGTGNHGDGINYLVPCETEEEARDKAVLNITDSTYPEFPVAIHNLDTGEMYYPSEPVFTWTKQ